MRTSALLVSVFRCPRWERIFSGLFLAVCLLFSESLVAQNDIVTENLKPGTPVSVWDGIFSSGDVNIQGFATDISVNKGQRVKFKIDVRGGADKSFTIQVYRLGFYQGNGATLVQDLGTFSGTEQPLPIEDNSVGLLDCGNWSESAFWDIPSNAVSGIYVAKLTRIATGGASHIVFVVRDDAKNSDILFKTSDATWQAYNNYGPSLYGPSDPGNPLGFGYNKAVKVSYNRPFFTRSARAANYLFNAEFAMLQWIERNGYDVKYTTDVDFDRDQTPILPSNHKVIFSVGHDEYWSKNQRDRFEAARSNGVHIAFFSGNEIYWKTRWEASIDGSGQSHRTLVCYKEGTSADMGEFTCGSLDCDPLDGVWTGLWRFGGQEDAGKPENMLSGQMSWIEMSIPLKVPSVYRNMRFWRNTSVAGLSEGETATLGTQILGYEWNYEQEKFRTSNPPGRILMSSTTAIGDGNCCAFDEVEDQGYDINRVAGKEYTHHLTFYRHSSGALVFSAGTINWAWGLEQQHDIDQPDVVPAIQQATVNILAEMGVQPVTLQSGLVTATATSDVDAPVVAISSPAPNTRVGQGRKITVTGTATDVGGIVAGVEVSIDGGLTWQAATITGTLATSINWTFSFVPAAVGNFTIQVRGVDDSGNIGFAGSSYSGSTLVLEGTCPCSVFSTADPVKSAPRVDDPTPITVGMKVRPSIDGYIVGARFYKDPENTGIHVAKLYSSSGSLLAQATFTNESVSGWQQISFPTPVPVTANSIYVVAYFSDGGKYSVGDRNLALGFSRGPISAPPSAEVGGNGVYSYSNGFPSSSYNASNYLVDAIFNVSPSCALDPLSITAQSQVCAGQPIGLRLGAVGGSGPYTLMLNEVLVNDVLPNTTFTASHLVANSTDLINTSVWPSGAGGLASSVTELRELGVRFVSSRAGYVNAVRFFKTVESGTGTFSVRLYDMDNPASPIGFGSVTINTSDVSGWQVAPLIAPVLIDANKTYVASYVAPNGRYAESPGTLGVSINNGPLTVPASTSIAPNGLYKSGTGTEAPSLEEYAGAAINYWVDVLFTAVNQVRFTQIVDAWGVTCFSTAPNFTTLNLQPVSCAFLPVTLTDFRIGVQSSTVTLQWSTASESNNKGFEVQRSRDGAQWSNVGFVNGAVNSQVPRKYQFADPNLTEGRYFYRLKQVDLDGKFTLTRVLNAMIGGIGSGFALGQNYPNPSGGHTTISYTVPSRTHVQIALYDMQGRLVRQLVNESREAGMYSIDLNTNGLGKGVYHYKMKAGEFLEAKRLLVN